MSHVPTQRLGSNIVRIFLHIQKTAGTSVRDSLTLALPNAKTALLYPAHVEMDISRFKMLPQEERDSFDLIIGHMFFGLHSVLGRSARYITFLRDPMQRIQSHYRHYRKTLANPLEPGGEPMMTLGGQAVPLRTVVEEGLIEEFDNYQVRVLAPAAVGALPGLGAPLGTIAPVHVFRALVNLQRHFDFVGCYELLQRDWPALTDMLGAPPIKLAESNRSERHDSLDEDFHRIDWNAVAHRNRFDGALYQAVRQMPGPVLSPA